MSELRHRFSEVEALLRKGKTFEVTKRGRVIALLIPQIAPQETAPRFRRAVSRSDFLGRLRAIFGDKVLSPSGAELPGQERERF